LTIRLNEKPNPETRAQPGGPKVAEAPPLAKSKKKDKILDSFYLFYVSII